MYVLTDFKNHRFSVGKCSILFRKIESILELLLKHVFLPLKVLMFVCSVQHYCKELQQEPTVDSIDDAKTCLNICVCLL